MSNVAKYDDLNISRIHLPYTILRDAILTHPTTTEELSQLLTNVPSPMSPGGAIATSEIPSGADRKFA
jgi:hypothetical protein